MSGFFVLGIIVVAIIGIIGMAIFIFGGGDPPGPHDEPQDPSNWRNR